MSTASIETTAKLDYYDLLGLDRGLTTEEIREQLEHIKNGWLAKAHRAGKTGQDAQAKLALTDEAMPVFANEAARSSYDSSLKASPAVATETAVVDWTARAWTYYFADDDGAASVAARKAKEKSPDDAMAFVIAAWVALLQGDLRAARADSDEAFVLDELGDDSTDVHHVRGVVYHHRNLYTRALKSYDRALRNASPLEEPELLWRRALSLFGLRRFEDAFDAGLIAMSRGSLTPTMRDRIERTMCSLIDQLGRLSENTRALMTKLKARITNVDTDNRLKNALIKFVDLWGQKAKAMEDLQKLRTQGDPEPPLFYGWAGKAAIGAVVSLVIAQMWSVGWVLLIACVAVAGFSLYTTKQYNDENSPEKLLEKIDALEKQLQRLDTAIDNHLMRTPKAEEEYTSDIAQLLNEI